MQFLYQKFYDFIKFILINYFIFQNLIKSFKINKERLNFFVL